MAMLTFVGTAPEVTAVMETLALVADALPKMSGNGGDADGERSGSRRGRAADALVALCAATAADPAVLPLLKVAKTPMWRAGITISAAALLGLADTPGELAGYGPIPASMARALAGDAAWAALVTDARTGRLLELTPYRYRPGAALRALVIARDQTCAHPGCLRPAERCDLDHVRPFDHTHPEQGGTTTPEQLRPRCRRDHNLKTWSGWFVRTAPDGTLVHRTPLGRVHVAPPPPQPTDDPDLNG
jgi:hypothetical protein